jgi:hypothetical protein
MFFASENALSAGFYHETSPAACVFHETGLKKRE